MKKITLISILTLFILSVFTASILADFYVVPTKIKEWAPVEKTGAEDISVYTEVAGEDILLQKGVAWPDPRFIDNGDGTVTDHLTGLMWMQDADCMGPITGFDSDGTPNDGKVTWQHALDFIDAVNAGTYDCGCTGKGIYSDWRLSNIKELLSLIDYGKMAPALQYDNIFSMPEQSLEYWSSTSTKSSNGASAWKIDINIGFVLTDTKTVDHRVWPVRDDK